MVLLRCVVYGRSNTHQKTEELRNRDTGILVLTSQRHVEAAWPSGQRVGLAIRPSRVRVPLWPLAGFMLCRPEFKFSATLVNSQLVAFCQLGFLILLCCI